MKLIPEEFLSIKDKLKSKLKETENGCLEWMGARNPQGYGIIASSTTWPVKYTHYLAHRLFYFLETGIQPRELQCCHRCDNTSCCAVSHIFLGTQEDNNLDAFLKGRIYKPKPFERSTKIPRDLFELVKTEYEATNLSVTQVAAKYNINDGSLRGVFAKYGIEMSKFKRAAIKLGVKEITEIRKLRSEGVSPTQIAGIFNIRTDYVWQIYVGWRWGHIRTPYDPPNFKGN